MSIFDSGPHSRTPDLEAKIPSCVMPTTVDWPKMAHLRPPEDDFRIGRLQVPRASGPSSSRLRMAETGPHGRGWQHCPRSLRTMRLRMELADVPCALPHDGRTFGLATVLPDTEGFFALASAKVDGLPASCDIDDGPQWTAGTTLLPLSLAAPLATGHIGSSPGPDSSFRCRRSMDPRPPPARRYGGSVHDEQVHFSWLEFSRWCENPRPERSRRRRILQGGLPDPNMLMALHDIILVVAVTAAVVVPIVAVEIVVMVAARRVDRVLDASAVGPPLVADPNELKIMYCNIFHDFTLKLTSAEFHEMFRPYDIMFFAETDMLLGEEMPPVFLKVIPSYHSPVSRTFESIDVEVVSPS
ncbi:hypothetical protein C8J57DRAFT_1658959 [Mycena rebaudengoi]|nr:hypothetical protein C8J57DRAFT_1658959 [Mycena rebaudengoi]